MKRRIFLAFCLIVGALPLVTGGAPSHAQDAQDAQDSQDAQDGQTRHNTRVARRRPPPDNPPRPIPDPPPRPNPRGVPNGLVAHEWGVFVLENGQPTYLDELIRELPPFVQRVGGPQAVVRPPPPPGPPPPPRPGPGPGPGPGIQPQPPPGTVARKPVLFLYADQPTQVHIEVGFTGGEPWMAYPAARPSSNIGGLGTAGLSWDLTVAPTRAPAFHSIHRGHWWKDLRAAGASALLTASGQSEGFIFFDGPVAFEPSFNLDHRNGGAAVTPASTERMLFLLEGDRYVEADLDPDTWRSRQVAMGGMAELRARLDQELQRRGLTNGEARSLLETWRDDLFRDPTRRAIYFVPRGAYDRMLPLRMTPTPTELVRVGLVIDRGTTRGRHQRPPRRRR